MVKFVSAYVERDKKNFKFSDFWLKPLAQMIEKRVDLSLRLAGTGSGRVYNGLVLLTNRKDYELFNKI